MSPRLRLTLFAVAGAAVGVTVGVDLADESYGFAVILALFSAAMIAQRASDAPADAWLLGATLLGYVVGNRGFAQLQPSPLIPLLPAEAVLLVAVPALALRMALKKAAGVRRDALNYAILAWMIVGTLRLPVDLERFGVVALRDYATIYYGAFFFIAQEFGAHAGSAKVLTRTLTFAFLLLLPVVVSIQISPDFLVDNLTWRGIPIIYQKSDLIATSLAAGFFWLWTRMGRSRGWLWFLCAAASLLLISAMASPRAAMAAVALTLALWLLSGRWRIAAAVAGIAVGGAALALAALSVTGRDLRTSAPYSAYEHAVSIFDVEGTGTYINGESGDPGDNNRFRVIWWRDVIDETASSAPVFGLGFGSDLASRFLADYDLLGDESFAARSPHSIVVTVFGRLGFVGLLAWIGVVAGLGRMVWRLFRRGDADSLGLASVACVILISACVGVVLESPMGAVIFWTVAGLGNARALATRATGASSGREAADNWPVAKSVPLHSESSPR
jgi:hypothetical protein